MELFGPSTLTCTSLVSNGGRGFDLKLYLCLRILASRSFPGYTEAPLSFFAQPRPDYESSSSAFLPERCRASRRLLTLASWLLISTPLWGRWRVIFIIFVWGWGMVWRLDLKLRHPILSASSRFKKNASSPPDLVLSFPLASPVFTLSHVNFTTISTPISFLCFNRRQNYKKWQFVLSPLADSDFRKV